MNLSVPTDPKYWHNRAEEAWSIAEQMTNAHTKGVMVGIAQSYEEIAKWAEEAAASRDKREIRSKFLRPQLGTNP
jgi:hypothetical protein